MIPETLKEYYESRRPDRRKLIPRYEIERGDGVMFRDGCTGTGPKKLLAVDPSRYFGSAIFDMETWELEHCWASGIRQNNANIDDDPVRGAEDHSMSYSLYRDTLDIVAAKYNIAFVAHSRQWKLPTWAGLFVWGFFGITSLWCRDRKLSNSWHLWSTIKDYYCSDEWACEAVLVSQALKRWPKMPIVDRTTAMAALTGMYVLEEIICQRGNPRPFYVRGRPIVVSPSCVV